MIARFLVWLFRRPTAAREPLPNAHLLGIHIGATTARTGR